MHKLMFKWAVYGESGEYAMKKEVARLQIIWHL